jgi:mannose-6-phosphate isomerase
MKNLEKLVSEPIFFERNRVYRIYKGGMPYKSIFNDGYDDGTDNMFPEEWVASKVKAINPKYFGKRDGVSVVKDTDIFFDDLLEEYKDELLGHRKYDCLVKFLDSAIRLPFQVHPTKDFSRKHFNSEYGKTEAWLVVATRPGAKLYFGFKDKMTKELLSELEERSETEKDIMTGILAGVDAKPGDIWLIKAGLIHAIGAGCTIIEVQEPTDFTIQPERWCGDYHISYQEEYIGLDKSTGLDFINYDIYGEKAIAFAKVNPTVEVDTDTYKKEVMISYDDTPCFGEVRHTV